MYLDPSVVDTIFGLRITMTLNIQTIVDRTLLPGALMIVTELMVQGIVLLRQAPGNHHRDHGYNK